MFRLTALLASAIVLALPGALPAQQQRAKALDPRNLDTRCDACEDFYQYANGGWLKRTPIPAAYAGWGSFNELTEKNNDVLRELIEGLARVTSAPAGSNARRLGDFYTSCMDSTAIQAAGAKPLAGELARIEAISDAAELQKEIARLHRRGADVLFGFAAGQDAKNSSRVIAQLSQGGLGLPDRDYYTNDDERTRKLRDEYVAHMTKMFALAGDTPDAAARESQAVMQIETELAQASMTRVAQRDPNAIYHLMSTEKVVQLTPRFAWARYLEAVGADDVEEINIAQPKFIGRMNELLAAVSLEDWKSYLRWHLLAQAAPALSSPFVNERFRFNGMVLTGAKELQPRWKRCLAATNGALGEALGQVYVAKTFSPEAKARALDMVKNLSAAFRDRLVALQWMGPDTRAQALAKLDAFTRKIGYPDKWRDYSKLDVERGSYAENVWRANEFELQRVLDEIGEPVDRTEWGMTPPTVNAYYNPAMNEIVFPAGILQPPFFDPKADDAVNYGGMGAVIGHEITHGFDDEGRQYDARGNLSEWWSAEDREKFQQRAALVEGQFSSYVAIDSSRVNGKLTLGENIADLGGLTIAYAGLQKSMEGKPRPPKIDGFTAEQRFFLAWAQIWRRNERPEQTRLGLQTDPHSPARYRTNGPLSNMPAFAKAFGCNPGDTMVRRDSVRAEIW